MAYSLDSVYKAAEESRARRAAEEAELEKELTASLRTWKPPSFDPRPPTEVRRAPLPTVEEVEAIRAEAARLGMESGHSSGYAEGKQEGYTAGHLEGMQKGHEEGYKAGYEQGKAEIERLTSALNILLESIDELPAAMGEPMAELAYQVGERLAGKDGMDRAPFVSAVQEALLRLPKPGEKLFFRVRAEEAETWKRAIDDPGLPFKCTLVVDENIPEGHAYVEAQGMRLNVGEQARRALVRTALGLDASSK
jgi:flagellar assembly protein FliH